MAKNWKISMLLLVLFLGGCGHSSPSDQVLQTFRYIQTACAQQDGQALYALLSTNNKKRLAVQLGEMQNSFAKEPSKARDVLKEWNIDLDEFKTWKGPQWIHFLLSKSHPKKIQKARITNVKFERKLTRALLTCEMEGPFYIILVKEGLSWKIAGFRFFPPKKFQTTMRSPH